MKLGLITQIRNEIDLIGTFIDHVDSLFDRVYLIDHQSIDGTENVLKQAAANRPEWKYFYLDIKAKVQSEVSNLLIPQIFADGVDYLFFLDADEFIDVRSRQELEIQLQNWSDGSTVGVLNWKNCICDDLGYKQFSEHTSFWIPAKESNFQKIIISKELFDNLGKKVVVSQGHHNAFDIQGNAIPGTKIGSLIHIPIRSLAQAEKKVIQASIAYTGFSYNIPGNNFQYYEMLDKIANGKITDDDVRGFTIGFERPGIQNSAVSLAELAKRGYTVASLESREVALSSALHLQVINKEIPLSRLVALILNKLEQELPVDVPLSLEGNTICIDENRLNLSCEAGKEAEDMQAMGIELDEQNQEIDKLNQKLKEINHFVRIQKNKVKSQEMVIKSLDVQMSQLKREIISLSSENVMYVNSRSWRLTRPLRQIKKLIGG